MKEIYLVQIMKSHYCKLVFLIGFIGSYFLLPQRVFYDGYIILALLFMLGFGLTFACIIRNIKERMFAPRVASGSILGTIATIIGLSAMQLCGVGLQICGMSLGFGILSVVLPSVLLNFLISYAVPIVIISIIIQIFSLWQMNCFRSSEVCCAPTSKEEKK